MENGQSSSVDKYSDQIRFSLFWQYTKNGEPATYQTYKFENE